MRPNGANRRSALAAFTLMELLVVVAILAILVAMLLPSLSKARDAAKSATCVNNLRQLFIAAVNYTDEYDGLLPPWENNSAAAPVYYGYWPMYLLPYLGGYSGLVTPSAPASLGPFEIRNGLTYKSWNDTATRTANPYYCPSTAGPSLWPTYGGTYGWAGNGIWCDYGINQFLGGVVDSGGGWDSYWIARKLAVAQPATQIVLFADTYSWNGVIGSGGVPSLGIFGLLSPRHGGLRRMNMVFVDGHVESDMVIATSQNALNVSGANLLLDERASWAYSVGAVGFKYFLLPN